MSQLENAMGAARPPLKNYLTELSQFLRFPALNADPETAKVQWLIRLRWIAIATAFLLCGPALYAGQLGRESVPNYLGLVSLLFLFNLYLQLSSGGSTSLSTSPSTSPFVTCFHLAFDLVILTLLLILTGGFGNPFVALFLLNVSLGGVLISGRLGWPFLYLSHLLLASVQIRLWSMTPALEEKQLLTTFAVYHFMLLSFWLVTRSLGAQLEKQHRQQSQSRLNHEKQDRLRAIGSLAAGFSHEFASPLNAAKIRLERLARNSESEDVREARASLAACESIIHRMNSAQLDLSAKHLREVPIGELLNDVIDSWREENSSASLSVLNQVKSNGEISAINFAQVILNLLDNAVEAAPGSMIQLQFTELSDRYSLVICDEGPGLPSSVSSRLGEPFVTTKSHGTGLGLYVSTLFAQSLGGELVIRQRSPRGTEVRLEWPLRGGQ